MDFHSDWTEYYDDNQDREPRPLLLDALSRFGDDAGRAVDIGCGAGADTLALLERGWSVLAVDEQQEAIDRILSRVPAELAPRLSTAVRAMEDLDVPPVDLAWASFSLFFCRPERFDDVWTGMRKGIRVGGRFAGQLLGERDTWAARDDITAFSEAHARALFDGFEIERFDEEEKDDEPGPKHWHVFHVIARRT